MGHSYVVTANRRLAHEMSRAGGGAWEVTAAAPLVFHGQNDLGTMRLQVADGEPCPVVALPARLTNQVHVFFYGRRLRSLLRQGWDVVHCWEEPYILAGAQVAWWLPRGTPLVYRTAQSLPKRYPPPFNALERFAMRRAAGWICSGRTVADNLAARPGYAGKPMRRIPLGVDLEAFRPDPAAAAAVRRELGWDDGPPVVGFLGRLVPEKGIDLLTRVLDGLRTPWRALFVGVGPLEGFLNSWAARHEGRVRVCTGVRHGEVPRYLAGMDVLCAPSQTTPHWREQFGRMLVEAFACGVPVVGSDSGEIPHVVNGIGVVVGEADEAGWREALAALLDSPRRREEMGRLGRDCARTCFAWPAVARQYLEFFEELSGPSRARSAAE
jgi:glycosyltransferase involved in cell wall biosynthesis